GDAPGRDPGPQVEGPGPRPFLRPGPADPAHHLRSPRVLRAQDPPVAPGRGPPHGAPAPPGAPPLGAGPQAIGLPVLAGPGPGGGPEGTGDPSTSTPCRLGGGRSCAARASPTSGSTTCATLTWALD